MESNNLNMQESRRLRVVENKYSTKRTVIDIEFTNGSWMKKNQVNSIINKFYESYIIRKSMSDVESINLTIKLNEYDMTYWSIVKETLMYDTRSFCLYL